MPASITDKRRHLTTLWHPLSSCNIPLDNNDQSHLNTRPPPFSYYTGVNPGHLTWHTIFETLPKQSTFHDFVVILSSDPERVDNLIKMSQTDETLVDGSATQTAKELFAGAAGGVTQVLIGTL